MQNLIYLIIIALAGGAGYWAGGWKGKDATQQLAVVKDASAELDQLRKSLTGEHERRLKDLAAERDAQLAQVAASAESAQARLQRELAQRDVRIATLDASAKGLRQRADALAASTATTTDPAALRRLQDEIAALRGQASAAEATSSGLVCSKQVVPAELLAGLREVAP
jgi:chromosome segregation ATPase